MRRFGIIGRLLVVVLVLAGTAVFLIHVDRWDDVTGFVADTFGEDTAESVDEFGRVSEQAGRDLRDATDRIRAGEGLDIDWAALEDALDGLLPPRNQRHPAYDRSEFGSGWLDPDGNGCDARNDILQRDLVETVIAADGCVVQSGILHGPYSGQVIHFERGPQTSNEVHIDHIVPLALAWRQGAWQWDDQTRRSFANDPANLIAVRGTENMSKGDKAISEWLPPNEDHWCDYAANYATVFVAYDLPMSDEDKDTVRELADACAG